MKDCKEQSFISNLCDAINSSQSYYAAKMNDDDDEIEIAFIEPICSDEKSTTIKPVKRILKLLSL